VLEPCAYQLADVIVGERVKDVLALSATLHDALCVEDAKLLGQSRELGLARLGQLTHAPLPPIEVVQETQPREIAGGAEQRGGPRERGFAHDDARGRVKWSMGAAALGRMDRSFCHFNE
jgi:hypothetical protein